MKCSIQFTEHSQPVVVTIRSKAFVARIALIIMGGKSVAIVFGRTIYLYGVSAIPFKSHRKWLRHELEHVKQYQEEGFVGFLFKYLLSWIRRGYYHNRFEVAARKAESDVGLLERINWMS